VFELCRFFYKGPRQKFDLPRDVSSFRIFELSRVNCILLTAGDVFTFLASIFLAVVSRDARYSVFEISAVILVGYLNLYSKKILGCTKLFFLSNFDC